MKKIVSFVLAIAFAIFLTVCVSAKSADISVYLEGNEIEFDVKPQTINDRTMVPVRAIFEAMGASVTWDKDTKTVTSVKGDTTVKMTLNSTTEYIDGIAYKMDVPPIIIDGRTLVPARYVAEAFGYFVNWDQKTKKALISKNQESVSQFRDGTREYPYKFGDTVRINVFKIGATEPKATFDITLKDILSPKKMEKRINNSDYYTYNKDKYYLNCDVSLIYYEDDATYSFNDSILLEENFVTNDGTIQKSYSSWYRDPSRYNFLKLFEGDSGECYIPIDTSELDGINIKNVDYFTITTYIGDKRNITGRKTIWFSLN